MNYGRQGIKQKKKLLNSAATRLRTKLGVFAIKFILILAIAVVVSGSCLVLGSVQGIISSAPDVSTIDVSPDGFATKIYDNESNEIQTLSTTGSNRISVELDVVPLELQLLLQLKMNVFTNITALISAALSAPVITLLPVVVSHRVQVP